MARSYPASGFWLFGIDEKNGQVAITSQIWCGSTRAGEGRRPVALPAWKHRGRRRLHRRR
jgi:hypothetical protein